MNRRDLVKSAFLAAVSASAAPPVDLEDLTVGDIQKGFQSGQFSARSLTEAYLARIESLDRRGGLHLVIETNPEALALAEALDEEARRVDRGDRSTAFPSCSRTTSTPPTA